MTDPSPHPSLRGPSSNPERASDLFSPLLRQAIRKRQPFLRSRTPAAFRAFGGSADGIDGVFIDVFASGAVLNVYEGRPPRWFRAVENAGYALDVLSEIGVRAIYLKPFAKDRSKLGGELPTCATDPVPAAGEALDEALLIEENGYRLEVRLFDGLSTGLFLDQRANRAWVAQRVKAGPPPDILNTFAYTCAFSVAAARAGAATTSVDVSGRYLEWGKRNFAHNGLDVSSHRFAKMDTFEFLAYARRKGLSYDLIILDPPSFASGSRKKGIRPWSSTSDYARLVRDSAAVLKPAGTIFASSNTHELCIGDHLKREVAKGIGHDPKWLKLPGMPPDFAGEHGRFAACACVPDP